MKVEFMGNIELFYDRGHHQELFSLSQEVPATGAAVRELSGRQCQAYFIHVTMSRRMADVVKERDVLVHSFRMPPDSNNPIKMEVGIEDCLHIEFEYNKSKYHLKDVIIGKIYLRLLLTTGSPPNQYNESETITKFEIMDASAMYPILFEILCVRESTAPQANIQLRVDTLTLHSLPLHRLFIPPSVPVRSESPSIECFPSSSPLVVR
ncbi:vacuolar protein sorting-associated protein 26-domain-containing protein [Lactarius hatsudake]|nr:vacuolar protein sorting-associated protein 26-domain-containing protein [Lactarius hatsudake]